MIISPWISNLPFANQSFTHRGPLTGGHINPVVTLSTVITGLTPPLKGLVYMIAQLTGATVGGVLLALSLGPRAAQIENYGCFFNPSPTFSAFHASVFEFMGTFSIISMMYGEFWNQQTRVFDMMIEQAIVFFCFFLCISPWKSNQKHFRFRNEEWYDHHSRRSKTFSLTEWHYSWVTSLPSRNTPSEQDYSSRLLPYQTPFMIQSFRLCFFRVCAREDIPRNHWVPSALLGYFGWCHELSHQ